MSIQAIYIHTAQTNLELRTDGAVAMVPNPQPVVPSFVVCF